MKTRPTSLRRRENFPEKKKRSGVVLRRLHRAFPDARVALKHTSALELLISTILSAQCTDERVNMVTPALFKRYRTVNDFATAHQSELEELIRSTGFYRAKAKNVIGCARTLLEQYNGEVPDSMEDLVQLPGVGRKTANVVLSEFFKKPAGIVVDTHVKRLAERLGFSASPDAEIIEQDLMNLIPKREWIAAGMLLILHGRMICQARKPKCLECPVCDLCPSFGKFTST